MTRAAHKFISDHLEDFKVQYHGYTAGGSNEEVELTDKQSGERYFVTIEPTGAVRMKRLFISKTVNIVTLMKLSQREIENMKRCGICENYMARRGACHIDADVVNRADKCRFNPSEW